MRWRRLFVFPVLFVAVVLAAAELPTIAGLWEGKITLQPGIELAVLIDFQQENGVWKRRLFPKPHWMRFTVLRW